MILAVGRRYSSRCGAVFLCTGHGLTYRALYHGPPLTVSGYTVIDGMSFHYESSGAWCGGVRGHPFDLIALADLCDVAWEPELI